MYLFYGEVLITGSSDLVLTILYKEGLFDIKVNLP